MSTKVCGAGRLVETGVKVLSASATASADVAPSSYDVPPITTWSGTTVSGLRSTSCVDRPAVEAVTTCTRADMQRGYRTVNVRAQCQTPQHEGDSGGGHRDAGVAGRGVRAVDPASAEHHQGSAPAGCRRAGAGSDRDVHAEPRHRDGAG